MSGALENPRSIVIERQLDHPPQRVWRALTQPLLIAAWLMKNDFQLAIGHDFSLHGDWGTVTCKVLEIEQDRTLAYSWQALGLDSIVTWTLSPSGSGTVLRMEQSGFHAEQEMFYQGAATAWPHLLTALEGTLASAE